MNFNKKILYALMATGLCVPVTSVYAVWPFSSPASAPLIKIQEKAKEEVKKEATAQSARLLSAAVKGTGFVASKAAEGVLATTNEAVRLGLKYPLATGALATGGILYYYREQIKEKMKQVAPIVSTVGAVAAAKYGYDYMKSLFGSSSAQTTQVNNAPVSVVSAAPKAVAAPIIASDWAQEFTQQNAASQTEKTKASVIVPAQVTEWVTEFNAAPVELKPQERREFNNAWNQIAQIHKEQEEAKAREAEMARIAQEKALQEMQAIEFKKAQAEKAKLRAQTILRQRSEDEFDVAQGGLLGATDKQFIYSFIKPEFNAELFAQDRLKELEDLDIAAITAEPQESEGHEWAQEFVEQQESKENEHKEWVKQYMDGSALRRIQNIVSHLAPEETAEVHSLEDIGARMHQRDLINTFNNMQPHCAPTSLRPL